MEDYKGIAAAYSVSYYENGALVMKGSVIAEGNSVIGFAGSIELGKALAKGQFAGQGLARGLESAVNTLTAPKVTLLEGS